jgi:peptide/nickel transport system permease protein
VLAYTLRRFLLMIPTLLVISFVTFVIIQLPPGDYLSNQIAELRSQGDTAALEKVQFLRQQYGLDKSFLEQYAAWVGLWPGERGFSGLLQGDWGWSFEYNLPVLDVVGDRLVLSFVLNISVILFTWAVAFPIGFYAATHQYSWGDHGLSLLGYVGLATPNFLLALVIMYFAFVWFGASVGGLFSAEMALAPWSAAKVWDLIKHLPLPALILALGGTAQLIRIMRANLLDELRRPYVVTARAKGLSEARAIIKYPVRAALNPFASNIAYLFPYLVSGSIIVSIVLGLPTVGPLLVKALVAQDMFLAGTIVLLLGVMTVVGTFISDLVLMWVDPRIRHQMD